MLSCYHTKKPSSSANWKHILGKTGEEVLPNIGEPFASYVYNSEEVFLYDRGSISTIVLRNGIVIRCDDLIETRRTLRVQLSEKIPAIVDGEKKISGVLKDISSAGATFLHSSNSDLSVGSRIDVSFALSIEGVSRYFRISCRVHENRKVTHNKSTIILFDFTETPWKKKLLSRYVLLSSTRMELGLEDPFRGSPPSLHPKTH